MSDFKDIQDNWEVVEPQLREARAESIDLVHEMCELIKKMNAISERMNHFEAWFANVGDRLGTMEKRLDGYEQKLQIWVNGRGGMS